MRNTNVSSTSIRATWQWSNEVVAPDDYSEPHLDSAALHLDVASRHMKFQKMPLIHASMIHVLS